MISFIVLLFVICRWQLIYSDKIGVSLSDVGFAAVWFTANQPRRIIVNNVLCFPSLSFDGLCQVILPPVVYIGRNKWFLLMEQWIRHSFRVGTVWFQSGEILLKDVCVSGDIFVQGKELADFSINSFALESGSLSNASSIWKNLHCNWKARGFLALQLLYQTLGAKNFSALLFSTNVAAAG